MTQRAKRWVNAAVFVFAVAALLALIAYFQFFIKGEPVNGSLVSPRDGAVYAWNDYFISANNGGDTGYFDFKDRFLNEEPVLETVGETTYYSDPGVEMTITNYPSSSGRILVADVYVADIYRVRGALANDTFARGEKESDLITAAKNDALFSITGDNYSERDTGVEMRDGVLYSKAPEGDMCVLNWDGTMEIINENGFELGAVMDKKPYQIFSGGDKLLIDGEVPKDINTDYSHRQCAIGYVEKGHYVFVMTEGSMNNRVLAKNMQALSCKTAYALYGGDVASVTFKGKRIGFKRTLGRKCADIIYISNYQDVN